MNKTLLLFYDLCSRSKNMKLLRAFCLSVFVLALSMGMACKKSIPVVEQMKSSEALICAPEVSADVMTDNRPIIAQEVLVPASDSLESIVEKESVDKVIVDISEKFSQTESVPEIVIEDINFDLDSYVIREADKEKLQLVVEFLNIKPEAKIKISGNCDERGTTEYNLVLGERRAYAARNYLLGLGVAASRISTISYGKEKPKAYGHDKESWFINRNCQFLPQ